MNKERNIDDKLTIRCTREKGNAIRQLCQQKGETLCELLVDPLLENINTEKVKLDNLDIIAEQCKYIEHALMSPKDKIIFREGMQKIWNELLTK